MKDLSTQLDKKKVSLLAFGSHAVSGVEGQGKEAWAL